MALHASAALRFRGLLHGAAAGSNFVTQADRAIAAETIVNPARLCVVMAPAIAEADAKHRAAIHASTGKASGSGG